jgi:hypothetical protein
MRRSLKSLRLFIFIPALASLIWMVTADAQMLSISEQQKQYLDPQADDGKGQPTVSPPAIHDPRHTMPGMKMAANAAVAAPAAAPATGGQWSYLPSFPSSFNAPHMVVGKGGKILLVAGSGNNSANFRAGNLQTYIWNPATGVRKSIPTPVDLFCAGHVLMPDGRALVVGGTTSYSPWKGGKFAYAFNFDTEQYEKLPSMAKGRWYPSVVSMPDGRQVISAGFDEAGLPTKTNEIYNPKTNTMTALPGQRQFPLYPRMHLAANGRIFNAVVNQGFWDPLTNAFQSIGGVASTRNNSVATCFIGDVRDQNLIAMGGGWPGTNATRIINLAATAPAYRAGPPLLAAKGYLGCVNMPDNTLFEANGGSDNTIAAASTEAALLTSVNASWTPMTPLPAGEHRVYHAMLALLDDGRVLSMTSNPKGGEPRSTSVLAYSPPYMFKGQRPVTTVAPKLVTYGGSYPVAATAAVGSTVSRVIITTPPAPTHGMDTGQRSLSLPITNGTITMPSQATIMPPGLYRLWTVDSLGRPSTASWFEMR